MNTTYPRINMKAKDLRLADHVRDMGLSTDGWNDAVVKQITDTHVTLFRPYGTNADFSYTGGVICYIGISEYNVPIDSSADFYVFRRTELQ